MKPEALLVEISAINRKYELITQKTGSNYNIFQIANIATDEVTICRVIHDLLDPKGFHGQGNLYLKLFFQEVLGFGDVGKLNLDRARVYREYVIEKQRRIDLMIITPDLSVPIEVKLLASDQEEQCQDYFNYARNAQMYYLTLLGEKPSLASLGKLKCDTDDVKGEVAVISFQHHILAWLRACLEQDSTISISSIREIMMQLVSLFENLTGQIREDKVTEIKQILSSSAENMCSAVSIASTINVCKRDLLRQLFQALDKELQKNKSNILFQNKVSDNDKKLNDAVDEYYSRKRTYPSLRYVYHQGIRPHTDIHFVIQLGDRLYAGFYPIMEDGSIPTDLTETEILGAIPNLPQKRNVTPLFLHWEFLPDGTAENSPNFNIEIPDNKYLELFEKKHFDSFVDDCVKHIITMI